MAQARQCFDFESTFEFIGFFKFIYAQNGKKLNKTKQKEQQKHKYIFYYYEILLNYMQKSTQWFFAPT